jgi:hypothetical protein
VDRQARAHAAPESHDEPASDHASELTAPTSRFTSAGAKPPVARDATSPPPPSASDRAFAEADVLPYLATHREPAWHAVAQQPVATPWQLPPPLVWRERTAFSQLFTDALHGAIDLNKPSDVHALIEHPAGFAMLAPVIPHDRAWSPGVGALFAQLVVGATGRSIERVARRYLAHAPLDGVGPLDRCVALTIDHSPVLHDPADTAARELVAAREDTDHVTARWKFFNTLDRVSDPETRARMKARFYELTHENLEYFIQHADWCGTRDKEQAFALISYKRDDAERELAALAPEKRKKLELDAFAWAGQVLAVVGNSDANDDVNAREIFRVLGPRSPVEIEAIRAAMRKLSSGQHTLYEHLDRSLARGNEGEAVGALDGDPVESAQRGLINAHDVPRAREILRALPKDVFAEWQRRYADTTRRWLVVFVPPGHERAELLALVDGDKLAADRARVEHLLADPIEGAALDGGAFDEATKRRIEERSPEHVIAELEQMKPADLVKLSENPKWTLDRFDTVTRERIRLLLAGKRVEAKALALHYALAAHDQKAIEAALATSDPKERAAIAAAAPNYDAGRWRSLDDQLAAHYKDVFAGKTDDDSIDGTTRALAEKKSAADDERAAKELAATGALSEETQLHRARANKQELANLLEAIPTNRKLHDLERQYRGAFKEELLPLPNRSLGSIALRPGDNGWDEEAARDTLDANEWRIDNVRYYGVPAERPPELQARLQEQLLRKQHSGALENAEVMRAVTGGSIGSTEIAREGIAAQKAMAKAHESPEQLERVNGVNTKLLEVQRAEKQKVAAHWGGLLRTLGKIIAVCTGDAVLFAIVDIAADLSAMAAQKYVAGEAYDPVDDEKHLVIDLLVDSATAGIAARLEGVKQNIAVVGANVTGGVVGDIVDGRSPVEILGDALGGLALMTVPGAFGARFQGRIGKAVAETGAALGLSGGNFEVAAQTFAGKAAHGGAKPHETIRVETDRGPVDVQIRRTDGKPRVVRQGDSVAVEIPHELVGAELARVLAEQLHAASIEIERGAVTAETIRDLGPIEIDGVSIRPEMVPDHEFAKIAGAEHRDAVVLIENGKPRIVMREGAPASALREELTHLAQWKDPAMRARMMRLGEDKLAPAAWKQLTASEKRDLHLDKLEVEADAQRRIIADLSGRAEHDGEALLRVQDADETLFKLGQKIDKLRATRGQTHLDEKELGIDEPPRLFAGGAQSPKRIEGPKADEARAKLIGRRVEEVKDELARLGYTPNRLNGRWRLTRASGDTMREVPHLVVSEKTGLIDETNERASFAERKEDAAREWRRISEDLDGEQSAETPRFREELSRRVAEGRLDEGDAGLFVKWAPLVEEMERRGMITREEALGLVHGKVTETGVETFRRTLRARAVEGLMRIPAESRMPVYEAVAGHMPDEPSRGHFFTAFREAVMKGSPLVYDVETFGKTSKPAPFEGKDLKKPRQPDGVTKIRDGIEGQLPGGRYAIEDKTGPNAFIMKQAEDYARRSDSELARRPDGELGVGEDKGGFKLTKESTESVYDGMIYVFSNEAEATAALQRMNDNKIVGPIVGKHPGGIHVMYMSAEGELRMKTELPKRQR